MTTNPIDQNASESTTGLSSDSVQFQKSLKLISSGSDQVTSSVNNMDSKAIIPSSSSASNDPHPSQLSTPGPTMAIVGGLVGSPSNPTTAPSLQVGSQNSAFSSVVPNPMQARSTASSSVTATPDLSTSSRRRPPSRTSTPTHTINHTVNTISTHIYSSVYSGIPVYEIMCRGVAVMKRKSDNWVNATQILKVVGIEKGKRTKILEKEILQGQGAHEKVQGGYGKYQGTWIPFERGIEFARQYNVLHLLEDFFYFESNSPNRAWTGDKAPKESRPSQSRKSYGPSQSQPKRVSEPTLKKRRLIQQHDTETVEALLLAANALSDKEEQDSPVRQSAPQATSHARPFAPYNFGLPQGTTTVPKSAINPADIPPPNPGSIAPAAETPRLPDPSSTRYATEMMAMFLSGDSSFVPPFLKPDVPKPIDFDINMPLDDQGHTAVHWAAALARLPILKLLVQRGAKLDAKSFSGETALMRSVLVTSCFDHQTFPELLQILGPSIHETDRMKRTVLHHLAHTSRVKGHAQSCRYYMEVILDFLSKEQQSSDTSHKTSPKTVELLNATDADGNTALIICAIGGNRYMVQQLLDAGANKHVRNAHGLRATDFLDGIETNLTSVTTANKMPLNMNPRPMNMSSVNMPKTSNPAGNGKVELIYPSIASTSEMHKIRETRPLHAGPIPGSNGDSLTQLKELSRELVEARKQNQTLKIQVNQIPDLMLRIRNLEKSLEDAIELGNQAVLEMNKVKKEGAEVSEKNTNKDASSEVLLEEIDRLKREISAREKNESALRHELVQLRGSPGENEIQCKRIIAACCNVPIDAVDDLLGPLLEAIESDGPELDMSHVAGFINRVCPQDSVHPHVFPHH